MTEVHTEYKDAVATAPAVSNGSASAAAQARKRRRAILAQQHLQQKKGGVVASSQEAVAMDLSDTDEYATMAALAAAADAASNGELMEDTTAAVAAASLEAIPEKAGKKSTKRAAKARTNSDVSSVDDDGPADASSKRSQMIYNPGVPLPRDQLAAWRREARRVRNRESAAASRRKQKDRIDELELELSEWKEKYEEAVGRLNQLKQEGKRPPKSET
jgi:hypothetical protein